MNQNQKSGQDKVVDVEMMYSGGVTIRCEIGSRCAFIKQNSKWWWAQDFNLTEKKRQTLDKKNPRL